MPSLSFVRAANAKFSPSYLPVAVFVGGTSGIGQAMAEAFSRYTKGNAHVIIVGRNRTAAESILSSLPPPPTAAAKREFFSCDATLMRNVSKTSNELLAQLSKINYLVLSPGFLSFSGRDETDEGIDKKLALNYYARWKFIDQLLPLLRKAKESGETARVISVFAAGQGGKIDLNDLGLKKGYGLVAAAGAGTTYTDAAFLEFATRNPDIGFAHIYPGVVNTSMSNFHWSTRLIAPVISVFATSPADCAEYMLYALTAPEYDKGAWFFTNKADQTRASKWATEEARKKIWEHTVQATTVVPDTSA